jgi:hypothetical protein
VWSWMSYSFRFYCCSSGFDIFTKYGYYDIKVDVVKIFVFSLHGVGLCKAIWNWR